MSDFVGLAQLVDEQPVAAADSSGSVIVHGPWADRHPHRADESPASGDPHQSVEEDLRTELAQLRRAMQTRPTIDQACGMLMATFHLNPQQAWDALVMTSQHTNTKLSRLATDLVGTIQGDPLPKATRGRLAAAVTKVHADAKSPEAAS
jgi:hypothetical protein